MLIKNIFLHFKTITYHRWLVFKLCLKSGEPWRGFVHDLSKYSPTEFFEGVKYYNGLNSPNVEARKQKGYSRAWLHHKGRNKHHEEYWVDLRGENKTILVPYKYAVEMICDKLAAGMAYKKEEFTYEYELEYWKKEKEILLINEKTANFITEILEEIVKNGLNSTLNKENLRKNYEKYCK